MIFFFIMCKSVRMCTERRHPRRPEALAPLKPESQAFATHLMWVQTLGSGSLQEQMHFSWLNYLLSPF